VAIVDYRTIDFYNIVNGLNTVDSAIRLRPEDARDTQNMDLFPIGGFSKRNGYQTLNAPAVGTAACSGLYMARYSTAGGTNYAFLFSGTKLYSMSGALGGTWTDSTNGRTITTGANNIWNFAILNDIVMTANGTDTPIRISSTPTATALSGTPFSTFLFPVESRGYMWYFRPTVGGTVLYDRGYFSAINDPTTVATNDFVDFGKGQGGGVTGAVDYKTFLYVFKRHGIFQTNFQPTAVNSSGDVFPWAQYPNPVVPGVGTQSHRSIVKFTTPSTHATPGQELVFFIDQYGVPRVFDGTTTISFASKIGSSRDSTILSLSDMDNTRLPYCWAVNYPSKNRILFFLSRQNSQQDICFVLDYNTGFAIARYKYASAFNVGYLFEKPNGTFKPYFGDYAGTVVQSDQGTSDNGQPIDDYYINGDTYLTSPNILNKWRTCDIRGSNGSSTQNTKITYYLDGTDTPIATDTVSLYGSDTLWGEFIWGEGQWSKKSLFNKTSEIKQVGKTLRVKIESLDKLNDTLAIEGFSLAGEPLGTFQD
jgi:hypothetical protein